MHRVHGIQKLIWKMNVGSLLLNSIWLRETRICLFNTLSRSWSNFKVVILITPFQICFDWAHWARNLQRVQSIQTAKKTYFGSFELICVNNAEWQTCLLNGFYSKSFKVIFMKIDKWHESRGKKIPKIIFLN